jgi:ABC-type sugar transport system substrate-binding protein
VGVPSVAGLMTRVRGWELALREGALLSVTSRVTGNDPATVGVPVMAPLLTVNPLGNPVAVHV